MNLEAILPAASIIGLVISACALLDRKRLKDNYEEELARLDLSRRLWSELHTRTVEELAVHVEREAKRQVGLRQNRGAK